MNVFKRLLMLSGGGTSVPYDYPDKFAFFADSAIVEPSILEVLRPDDRLGDFTVVRASDASYTDSSGVIQTAPDNVARIDYTNGVAELLTEPQSTNLITYSEDFSHLFWTKTGVTVDSNASTSPDGTLTADSILVESGGNISSLITLSTSGQGSASVYVKAAPIDSATAIRITSNNNSGWNTGLSTKAILTNEWQMIDISGAVTDNTTLKVIIGAKDESNGSDPDCVGNVLIWGAQVEELPYATSYIPTNGSTVTRLQDNINNGGNVNVINSEEGVLFFEGSALFDDTGENRYLSLSDGTENNVINISYNDTGALAQFLIYAGGALILTHAQPAVDITTNAKIAVKWKVNDFAIWINGVEVDAVLSGGVPTGLNSVNLSNAIGANYFNTRVKAIKVYDRALDDEELIEITTL